MRSKEQIKKDLLTYGWVILVVIIIAIAIYSFSPIDKPESGCEGIMDFLNLENVHSIICEPKWSSIFQKNLCGCDIYYNRGTKNETQYLSQIKAEIDLERRIVIWKGMLVE